MAAIAQNQAVYIKGLQAHTRRTGAQHMRQVCITSHVYSAMLRGSTWGSGKSVGRIEHMSFACLAAPDQAEVAIPAVHTTALTPQQLTDSPCECFNGLLSWS